jgi:hypothetical protein
MVIAFDFDTEVTSQCRYAAIAVRWHLALCPKDLEEHRRINVVVRAELFPRPLRD